MRRNLAHGPEQFAAPKAQRRLGVSAVVVHVVLVILALIVVSPLLIPFFFTFKTPLEFAYNPWGLPEQLRWTNFETAWKMVRIGEGLLNSAKVCLGTVLFTVPPAAMAGYVFAFYRSRITNILFYVVMAGFFVPVHMVLIPLYQFTTSIGINNSFPGVFLPLSAFGIPFWTIIYRSFYTGLPKELVEAGRIDGAGHFTVFMRIIFPMAKPATVLAVLLSFMGGWSDFIIGLIMLSSQSKFTMQLRISQFIGNLGANYFPQYAAGVIISSLPTILLYLMFYKYIIQGTTLAGAIKG
ncbi:MAG: carbohydrate ABC transporter permease [Limnochordia bacterium]|nr:carbohydrate ABC transporter permease [Limnochordia bacterium]